jgi:hypothetical protein
MSSTALIITGKQMRRARALVKWNLHDLANRTHISFQQLERFEHGRMRLTKPENDEVIRVFDRHSVAFDKNGGVTLFDKTAAEHEFFYTSTEFKTYNLDIEPTMPVVASPEPEGEEADSPEVKKDT